MNYEIVKMQAFSGGEASVYSIIPQGDDETLLDKFVGEYVDEYKNEIKQILQRIKVIGRNTGARESFFKQEGDYEFQKRYGKYVYALYDEEESNLRLYCIRFSGIAIILGGGGYKDKTIRRWQEDEKLSEEVRRIMSYAECILKQLDEGDLYWDGMELEGNLKNYDDE
ncbi:hypothetical protein [Runella zeae]|uniref:hypothetical protein n=1 Tax=Runella zeae TaxID=94255 RepID=UPI00235671F7|nr:hypothetical protein [Runella zeae]